MLLISGLAALLPFFEPHSPTPLLASPHEAGPEHMALVVERQFSSIDADASSDLDAAELEMLIFSKMNHDQSPPQATRGSSGSLAMRIAAQADALLQLADRNGDGKLSLGEWQLEYLAEKVDHGDKVAFRR